MRSKSSVEDREWPVAPLPVENWTGFYVAFGVMSSLDNKLSALPEPDPNSPGITATFSGLGAVGCFATISAGYDYSLSPTLVAGVFGDYDFHRLKSSINIGHSPPSLSPLAAKSVPIANGRSAARSVLLPSPSTLVFLSSGYTQLSLSNLTATVSGPFPAISVEAQVPRIAGGFIGAGIETKLTSNISLRGEYRFTGFDVGQVNLPTVAGVNANDFVSARIAPTMQVVKASVNYRF